MYLIIIEFPKVLLKMQLLEIMTLQVLGDPRDLPLTFKKKKSGRRKSRVRGGLGSDGDSGG